MEKLFPDKQITKKDFSGILMIEGDLKDNCIQFSFAFDKVEMVHPLLIWVIAKSLKPLENSLNEYNEKYLCDIRDINNSVIKTSVLLPRFLLEKHEIEVIDVMSHVSCHI